MNFKRNFSFYKLISNLKKKVYLNFGIFFYLFGSLNLFLKLF